MTEQSTFSLDVTDDGPVRWLTLSNPPRRNAITLTGFDLLGEAFDGFEKSGQRVLVITGSGGHFSSGADLSDTDFSGSTAAENAHIISRTSRAARALHALTKPTIAAVDGVAMGAAMNLALGCDVVISAESVRFSELFVRRGLALDFGGTWLLPRLVGLARARDIALTGREIGGTEALAMGLVSRLVPSASLHDEAATAARHLAGGASLAQQFIKAGMSRSSAMTFEQALAFESQAQAVLLSSDDVVEAIDAFLSKRSPEFRGR